MLRNVAFALISLMFFKESVVNAQRTLCQFTGQITSNHNEIDITARFFPVYISGSSNEFVSIPISVDKYGRFSFNLPHMNQPGRLMLQEKISSVNLGIIDKFLVEPTDSVHIVITIKERSIESNFSGRGSAKYNAITSLQKISMPPLPNNEYYSRFRVADSILQLKLGILNSFKSKMSIRAYDVCKLDITAYIYRFLISPFWKIFQGTSSNIDDYIRRHDLYKKFKEQVQNNVFKISQNDQVQALADNYLMFLIQKSKFELAFIEKNKTYSFSNLYNKLREEYAGQVREKLLLNCLIYSRLIYSQDMNTINEKEFSDCLKDAYSLIKTPELKQFLKVEIDRKNEGVIAFNFSLPIDTSDKRLSLYDLKGKVILLDIWTNRCGACLKFAKAFHEKVYPIFKNNLDFVVVSVMLDEKCDINTYRKILKDTVNFPYTSSEYINLFGGKGESMGRKIEKWYSISGYPTIFLIDKSSRIFSSTVPFFTDQNLSNVARLIELIGLAIKAPGSRSLTFHHEM